MDKLNSLGIDLGSIVFYIINTGILLAVLTYLLYKPVLRAIDKRQTQITDSIEEAEKLKKEFQQQLEESEKKRKEIESDLRQDLANLQKLTEEKKAEMIKEMEAKRVEMLEKAQQEIDQKKENLLKEAEKEVKELMTKIILHIVENKVPQDVIDSSIKSAWKTYSN